MEVPLLKLLTLFQYDNYQNMIELVKVYPQVVDARQKVDDFVSQKPSPTLSQTISRICQQPTVKEGLNLNFFHSEQ
jgi:hypothetical protein